MWTDTKKILTAKRQIGSFLTVLTRIHRRGFHGEYFSDAENLANNQLDDFTRRIGSIPFDVGLHVAFNDGFDASKLQSSRNKTIIKELKGWLAKSCRENGIATLFG